MVRRARCQTVAKSCISVRRRRKQGKSSLIGGWHLTDLPFEVGNCIVSGHSAGGSSRLFTQMGNHKRREKTDNKKAFTGGTMYTFLILSQILHFEYLHVRMISFQTKNIVAIWASCKVLRMVAPVTFNQTRARGNRPIRVAFRQPQHRDLLAIRHTSMFLPAESNHDWWAAT